MNLQDYFANARGMMGQAQQQQEPDEPQLKQNDEELDSLTTNLLRGFIGRKYSQGQSPSIEDFNKEYRQSVSPARGLLADIMFGISSSLTGQKFQSTYERRLGQWQQDQAMKQEQQKVQAQHEQQAAQIAAHVMEFRKDQQMKADTNQITALKNSNDILQKAYEFEKKYGLDFKEYLLKQRTENRADTKAEDERFKTGDDFFDYGLGQARAEAKDKGVNLSDPGAMKTLWERGAAIGNEYFKFREKIKGENRPDKELRPHVQVKDYLNPFGEMEQVVNIADDYGNLKTLAPGSPWLDPAHIPNVSPAQVQRNQGMHNAADSLRAAIRQIQQDPTSTGGFERLLSPDIRAKLGTLKFGERNAQILFNAAKSQYIMAMSGVATSAHEEQRLSGGLPTFFEKPKTFVPGALAFTSMLESMVVRNEAGIDPNDLDLSGAWGSYMDALQKGLTSDPNYKYRIPSAKEMIEIAAKQKGYKLIYDNAGHIRRMTK